MKKGERAARRMNGMVASPRGVSASFASSASCFYPSLLSSRNGCNSLKTLIDGAFYPSLKPGGYTTNIAAAEGHS
jgi:hypothetical protein